MNKQAFIEELRNKAEKKVNSEELKEIINYYSNYIDEVLEIEDTDEKTVIQSLGSIDDIINNLISGLQQEGIFVEKEDEALISDSVFNVLNQKITNIEKIIDDKLTEKITDFENQLHNGLNTIEKKISSEEKKITKIFTNLEKDTSFVKSKILDVNEDIEEIEINVHYFAIDIQKEDQFCLELINDNPNLNYHYEVKNKTLYFNEIINKDYYNYYYNVFYNNKPFIKLSIPNNPNLKISLKNHNQFINIKGNLVIKKLACENHDGGINLENIAVDYAKIKTHNGKINLINCEINEPNIIKNHNGGINIDNSKFNELTIETHNGGVKLNKLIELNELSIFGNNGGIKVDTIDCRKIAIENRNSNIICNDIKTKNITLANNNASIYCELIGNEQDINLVASNKTGNVTVNNNHLGNTVDIYNPNATINVRTTNRNGPITIKTKRV